MSTDFKTAKLAWRDYMVIWILLTVARFFTSNDELRKEIAAMKNRVSCASEF